VDICREDGNSGRVKFTLLRDETRVTKKKGRKIKTTQHQTTPPSGGGGIAGGRKAKGGPTGGGGGGRGGGGGGGGGHGGGRELPGPSPPSPGSRAGSAGVRCHVRPTRREGEAEEE